MAGFIFRLESFLKIKEKFEEKAKTEYGEAISKLEKEKEILKNLEYEKYNTILNLKRNIENGIKPLELKSMNEFIYLLDKKIEEQKQNIEKAIEFAEEKRQLLVEAMKDKKIFETLKEKEKEAYMKELLKKEQKVVDEIVSYKYNKG